MANLKRASLDYARREALPILLAGYEKRGRLRSTSEEKHRSCEKLSRDRKYSTKPHISAI